jgi:hypothetical protein
MLQSRRDGLAQTVPPSLAVQGEPEGRARPGRPPAAATPRCTLRPRGGGPGAGKALWRSWRPPAATRGGHLEPGILGRELQGPAFVRGKLRSPRRLTKALAGVEPPNSHILTLWMVHAASADRLGVQMFQVRVSDPRSTAYLDLNNPFTSSKLDPSSRFSSWEPAII